MIPPLGSIRSILQRLVLWSLGLESRDLTSLQSYCIKKASESIRWTWGNPTTKVTGWARNHETGRYDYIIWEDGLVYSGVSLRQFKINPVPVYSCEEVEKDNRWGVLVRYGPRDTWKWADRGPYSQKAAEARMFELATE